MSDKINNRINTTLESLNKINSASPKPFLLTRVNALLNKEQEESAWSFIAFYLKKPIVAAFAILLVLVVNIMVINKRNDSLERDSITKSLAPQKPDFAINVSVMYDSENLEQ